jgi:RHS repeat-associated protein
MPASGYSSEAVPLPKTRVWGSNEKSLHHFSATAPVSVELRWRCKESSGKTALGSGVSFKYDVFGRRIQKVFSQNSTTTTTNYVYDGADTIEETDQNGNLLAKYSRTTNIDEPLAESRSGTTSYYEQDGLGSVTSLTSAAGGLANTYTLDSFGKTTNSTGTVTNPFRYTGREFDTETNLYYYRARYYDSTAGRLLSEDPMGFRAGINFYRYVGNNPLLWRDPDGRGPDWGSLYNSFSNATSKIAWINCFVKLGYCSPKNTRTFNDMSTNDILNTAIAIQQSGGNVSSASNLDVTQGCNQDKNCIQGIEACVQQLPVAGPASPPSWWSWVLGKLK